MLAIFLLINGGCRSTPIAHEEPVVDEDFETANRIARLAFKKGQFEQAVALYRIVLEKAYIQGDGAAIADAKYNLAVCLMGLHLYQDALDQVLQSKKELYRDSADIPPDFLLLEASLLYRSNRLEDAWQVTSLLLSQELTASSNVLKKTHFLRGLIASDQGKIAQLQEAVVGMGQPASNILKADLAELNGRFALALNNWQKAASSFAEAVRLRRENLNYRRMGIALALSAQAYEKAGAQKTAALHYLQAGRSAALIGDVDHARLWLNRALSLSEQNGNTDLAQESLYYLSQLEEQ
jgi:tetratricopeptide (TPR) repeat protein